MFDRFQICEAYYLFLSANHGGQNSKEYAKLSKLLTYFKPSHMLSYDRADDDLKFAVDELESRNNQFCRTNFGLVNYKTHKSV